MDGRTTALWVATGAALFLGGVAVGEAVHADRPTWPSYADLYARVAPVVVNVSLDQPETRVGSGFAVSANRVVTARHLVVGADEVTVRSIDGRDVQARVVGTDARTDLALLVAEDPVFTAATLGSTAGLRVGDTVLAIGNPYGLGHSLAVGVVGSLARRLDEGSEGPQVAFLQLTIPLNPGNSGGPVFDRDGAVVAVMTGTHAQGQAIAFAVPVEALITSLPALEQGERVTRAYLGARTEDAGGGVLVVAVTPGGPSDRGGLRIGDRITAIGPDTIPDRAALLAVLDRLRVGSVHVSVVRQGKPLDVQVDLADRAEQPVAVAGMTLKPFPGTGGVVMAIRPRSRAEAAGIELGDVVRTVDGLPVQAPADVQDVLSEDHDGQVEILRGGAIVAIQLRQAG